MNNRTQNMNTQDYKARRKAIIKAIVKEVTPIRIPAWDRFARMALADPNITTVAGYPTKDYMNIEILYKGQLHDFTKYPIVSLKQDSAGGWYVDLNVSPKGAWSMNRDGTDNNAGQDYGTPTPINPPERWTNPDYYKNLQFTCTEVKCV